MSILTKSIFIAIGLIGVYYLYKMLYIRNMNKSLSGEVVKLKLVDINLFRMVIVFVGVIFIASSTVITIKAEHEKEIVKYKELVSLYDKMDFNDDVIEYFYLEYNTYFGGVFMEDDITIVCVTINTPLDGLAYLDEANKDYKFVNVNYMQLQGVYNLVVIHLDNEGVVAAAINHENNTIDLYVKTETIVSPELLNYIEEGLIEVHESNLTIVDTSE